MEALNKIPRPESSKTGWPWTEETDPSLYKSYQTYPKISIVMPTYNQGQFIEEAIRSLLLQNYPNLEFIVMDGGSNDNTVEIVKKYEPWITYWESCKDKGQSHAINKGLARCTGEWFNWLNSDDYLLPEALFAFAEIIIKSPKKPIAVCGEKMVINLNGVLKDLPKNNRERKYEDFIGMGYFQAAALYDIEKIRYFGGVDEDLHFTMDIKLVMQLNQLGETLRTSNKVMVARTHDESKGAHAKKFHNEWIRAYAYLVSMIPPKNRDKGLCEILTKVTGISFFISGDNSLPFLHKFNEKELQFGQLYMVERIINLMYANQKPGIRKLANFMKTNYPEFYNESNVGFLSLKSNFVIQMFVKLRNALR